MTKAAQLLNGLLVYEITTTEKQAQSLGSPTLMMHSQCQKVCAQCEWNCSHYHFLTTDAVLDQYAKALMDPIRGIPVGRRRIRLTTYDNSFSGTDAGGWFMANMEGVLTSDAAQVWLQRLDLFLHLYLWFKETGQKLMDLGLIVSVQKGVKHFEVSDKELYQFRNRSTPTTLVDMICCVII